jgi:serralysin
MPTLPSGSDAEITFLSGLTADGKIAAKSYWTWNFNAPNPGTYDSAKSSAFKWGPSQTPGTSGGTVKYFFDPASNWTDAEKAALAGGLHLWAAEANIQFNEVSSLASADFQFIRGNDGQANTNVTANPQVNIGDTTDGVPQERQRIWIDTSGATFGPIGDPSFASSFAAVAGQIYSTFIHEEGHALGLGHPGPYNAGDVYGGGPTIPGRQFSIYDNTLYSVMSYLHPQNTGTAFYKKYTVTGTYWGDPNGTAPLGQPTTPQMMDILAIQRIYGAPVSGPLHDGGQIFGFNSNVAGDVGHYFNFNINQNPIITIWDGGFGNTLDLSGFTTSSTIKLAPGSFTSTDGLVNNIGIAEDTWIDAAIGSQGINKITGNDHSNTLTGGPLGDTLSGGGGDDTLWSTTPRISSPRPWAAAPIPLTPA